MRSSYHYINVLGGHKLALSYFKKLADGKKDGEIKFDRLFCVTGDPKAAVFGCLDDENIIRQAPSEFIVSQFSNHHPLDTVVPDHTAKHLFLEVFFEIAKKEKINAMFTPFEGTFNVPFLRKNNDESATALSYATWACPATCDEPAVCPHTGSPRDWDFGKTFDEFFKKHPQSGANIHLFPCQTLFREIAQIQFSTISVEIKKFLLSLKSRGRRKYIVITHSRCHAILGQFEVNL